MRSFVFALLFALVGCGGSVSSTESTDAATSSDGASDTAIGDAGDGCGGKTGRTCASGMWCWFADGQCLRPDATGTCRKREALPCVAPMPGDEVCGCDGTTYQSACVATSAGMSIARAGACEAPTTKTCGGIAGTSCGPSEYCDWGALPNYCGGDDGLGTCKPRPTSCVPADGIYCGCDGKVYESTCAAAKAGVGVRQAGPC